MGYLQRYMERQQAERHRRLRTALRTVGWVMLVLGPLCILMSLYNLNDRSPSRRNQGPPWGIIIGVPLLAGAITCLRAGYLGVMTGYVAGEVTPPVASSMKHVAQVLKPTVRAMVHPPKVQESDELVQRLKRLEALRGKNLISDAEYAEKRAEILKEL